MIDEADKLLDHHFNQWLSKILTAVEGDKKQDKIREGQKSLTRLRNTLLGQCATSERLQLMFEDYGHSKVFLGFGKYDIIIKFEWCMTFETSRIILNLQMIRKFKVSPLSVAAPTSPLQKLLFSATMTQNPEHLAALNLHQPKLFTIASALESKGRDTSFTLPRELVQCTVRCSLEHKPLALLHLLTSEERSEDMKRVLCFTNSKESTHRCVACMDVSPTLITV